jgi:hypothetical protein
MKRLLILLLLPVAVFAQMMAASATDTHVVELGPEGVGILVVEWDNGPVTVIGADTDKITIEAEGNQNGRALDKAEWLKYCTFEKEGDRVVAKFDKPSGGSLEVELTVTLPKRIAADLSAGNGDIEVEMIAALEADAGNGTVTVKGTPGDIKISCGNGNVDIELPDSYKGDVNAESGNGNVDIQIGRGFNGAVDAESGNGNVTVTLAEVPGGLSVDGETGMGEAETNIDGVNRSTSMTGGSLSKSGDGPSIEVGSGNGDVAVMVD